VAAPPTLDELGDTPAKAAALAPTAAAELLARCLSVQGVLIARLLSGATGEPSSSPAGEPLLTLPQVGATLAVPASYAYELARRGELPTIRFGKYVRVRAADLQTWLARRSGTSAAQRP
jgi:excisionase family DNA binding protein